MIIKDVASTTLENNWELYTCVLVVLANVTVVGVEVVLVDIDEGGSVSPLQNG